MISRPTFPLERFELERQKVLNHVRSLNDDPETVGSHILNRRIYEGSPLSEPVLGSPESLEQMVPSDLRSFHHRKYGPSNTILIVVGDSELGKTSRLVTDHFAAWTNPALDLTEPPPVTRQNAPQYERKVMPKEQTTIYVGHLGVPRSNRDFYSLQVVDTILGGGPGFTSRIPKELRDNQGLAYSAYSDITGSSGIYPGRFAAYVCTSPENRERAYEGLLCEISKLLEKGVTESELEMAQDFLTGNFVFEFQGNASIARYLLAQELFQLGRDHPRRYLEAIRAVTCSEADRVARQYLDTINYTTVMVGAI
jgi:zinc protease